MKHNFDFNNKKKYMHSNECGAEHPRLYWRSKSKAKLKTRGVGKRVLLKCNCCDNQVDIYYCNQSDYQSVSINGVIASNKFWQEFLKKILKEKT